jgi:hypothetical protein
MFDENQTFIPDSYVELYRDSRGRLTIGKAELSSSYEMCEDMAQALVERCRPVHMSDGVDEPQILERCHAGLASPGTGFSAPQAQWVIRRTAELLDWQQWLPDFPGAAD